MDRLLSRALFVERLADGLGLPPDQREAVRSGANGLDPVALHRVDEFVSVELGVELPEAVLSPASNIDAIYQAYATALVHAELRGGGTPT